MPQTNNNNTEKLSFEEALAQLEKIVAAMEGGKLKLDEALSSFEQGMKLAKRCGQILGTAEKKIEILLAETGGVDNNGEWVPFSDNDGEK